MTTNRCVSSRFTIPDLRSDAMNNTVDQPESIRLDLWLWAARFFKTRALASEAIERGNVRLNNSRAKPSRNVRIDDELTIHKGPYEWQVRVNGIANKRGPASQAVTLYCETDSSKQNRKTMSEQLKLNRMAIPKTDGRPDKHQRKQIIKIKKG